MKLRRLSLLSLAFTCLIGSQQIHAADISISISSDIGKFATRTILFSIPLLVRTFTEKNVVKVNKYGRDIITAAVAALCWPAAFRR